jgi:predicted metal-dependent hydrolase
VTEKTMYMMCELHCIERRHHCEVTYQAANLQFKPSLLAFQRAPLIRTTIILDLPHKYFLVFATKSIIVTSGKTNQVALLVQECYFFDLLSGYRHYAVFPADISESLIDFTINMQGSHPV